MSQSLARIAGTHESLADEKGVYPCGSHALNIAHCEDPALGNDQPLRWHERQKLEGRFQACLEGF